MPPKHAERRSNRSRNQYAELVAYLAHPSGANLSQILAEITARALLRRYRVERREPV